VGLHFESAVRGSLEGSRDDRILVYDDTLTELPVHHSDGRYFLELPRAEAAQVLSDAGPVGCFDLRDAALEPLPELALSLFVIRRVPGVRTGGVRGCGPSLPSLGRC
jgi:hypothetical protein